jgi:hypothetical protein
MRTRLTLRPRFPVFLLAIRETLVCPGILELRRGGREAGASRPGRVLGRRTLISSARLIRRAEGRCDLATSEQPALAASSNSRFGRHRETHGECGARHRRAGPLHRAARLIHGGAGCVGAARRIRHRICGNRPPYAGVSVPRPPPDSRRRARASPNSRRNRRLAPAHPPP